MKTAHSILDWSSFDRTLQEDIALSEKLLAVLREERQALETREYGDLDNLIEQKKTFISQLEINAGQRRQWLTQHHLSDELSALDTARRQAPAVAANWEAAAAGWRECQSANQINEQICRRTRLVVERVLDILRGQNAASATYDAKGYSQRSQGGRTISNA